ncbi:MAG: M1 family metallopeptidase [Chloroflexi bacterium]|nr:M1 family metallopeptidase [Chloroflexota bacterium]
MTPRRNTIIFLIFISLAAGVLGACSSESQASLDGWPVTVTPADVLDVEEPTPLPSLGDAETGEAATPVGIAPALDPTLHYDIQAVLNWTNRTVTVVQAVTYVNDSGRVQDEMIFNVEVNRAPGEFLLWQVKYADGRLIENAVLDGTRLAIPINDPLPVGETVRLVLEFDLVLPQVIEGYSNDDRLGYWGYTGRQVNLGMWLPLLAAFEPERRWITPEFHWVGEHFLLRTADFTVDLQIEDPPENVSVAGPGRVSRPDSQTWRFEIDNAREVAFSVSDQFFTLQDTTSTGVEVELFHLNNSNLDAPRHALQTAVDAFTLFEDLYGPCPYDRLVVVQGDFPDGMEFSGLVFVSDRWFTTWEGGSRNFLTFITAHEVSHQWWYAMVGNDQGVNPYLDEALAIYSEVLFYERYYPDDLEWWWQSRVYYYDPLGEVDTPVYDFYGPREYINAIYLRGALMMEALRRDLGDEVFFAWLRTYATRMQGRVASPQSFWNVLSADQYAATAATREIYLGRSDVLPFQSDELP